MQRSLRCIKGCRQPYLAIRQYTVDGEKAAEQQQVQAKTKDLPTDFETYARVLEAALYGYTKEFYEQGFRPEPGPSKPTSHLHFELLRRVSLNTSLKRFPSPKELRNQYHARFGASPKREYSSHVQDRTSKSASPIVNPKAIRNPDKPKLQFSLDDFTNPLPLKVGDWIDFRRSESRTTGLVVRRSDGPDTWLVLTPQGRIAPIVIRQSAFIWPDWVDPTEIPKFEFANLVDLVSKPTIVDEFAKVATDIDSNVFFDESIDAVDFTDWSHTVTNVVDRDKWGALLQKLRAFELEVDRSAKMAVHASMADVYDRVKNDDPTQSTVVSCYSAAYMLLLEVLAVTPTLTQNGFRMLALALFTHMMEDTVHYTPTRDKLGKATFEVRAYAQVADLLIVREWARQESEPYLDFLDKAERLIAGGKGESFTDNDQRILRVLKSALTLARFTDANPYIIAQAPIVDALLPTSPVRSLQEGTRELLEKLKVISPWQNLVKADAAFEPWEATTSAKDPKLDKVELTCATTLQPDKLNPVDSMVDLRHDYTARRVFVIDSNDARELDDGISIEDANIADRRPTYWVRVYVADPTSVLHPHHTLSVQAFHRRQSLYTAERIFPMLAEDLMAEHGLSLGSCAGKSTVMCFSIRINDRGDLIECETAPAYIQNPIVTTYDAVDTALGKPPPDAATGLILTSTSETTEGNESNSHKRTTFDRQEISDLELLSTLADTIARRPKKSSAVNWAPAKATTRVHSPIVDGSLFRSSEFGSTPLVTTRIPGLNASIDEPPIGSSPSSRFVSTFAVEANKVAAEFGIRHSLPLPYLRQAAPDRLEDIEVLAASRDPLTNTISVRQAVKLPLLTASRIDTTPGGHWGLGISQDSGYVRATSPLRRFNDMVAHWQIKAALMDAKISQDQRTMAFFRSLVVDESAGKRIGERADLHWTLWNIQLAHDKWQKGETSDEITAVFDNLTAVITRAPWFTRFDLNIRAKCQIPELGVAATLVVPDLSQLPELGQKVRVTISGILLTTYPSMTVTLKSS